MADNSLILSALVPLLVGLFFFLRRKDTRTDFPPGPSPIPILGNIHQLPLQKSFFKLTEWGREYGPIVGLQLGPQKAVVLNTWTAVRDLLDQRGAIYSSRPSIPIVQHMELADAHAALMKYDKNWRRARKTIAEFLKDSEVEKRAEVQNAEATQMIWEIMTNPGEYREHVMRSFAAVVLATVYGRRGKHAETNRFFEINGEWSALLDPGAVPPLDVFPFLKYVPDWLTPWRGWRERADDLKRNQDAEYTELFQHARDRVAQGKADDSFVARLLMEQENEGYTDHELEHIAGLLLEGGSETSAMTFLTFMLAMIGFPESQKRAQEEVDAVFGEWKMPDEIDATKLPYLTACFWETLRWRPIAPLAIAHATTKDDTYQGYFIPANTTVIMNTWAISHNPDDYPSPDTFDPSRFLDSKFGTAATSETDAWRRPSYAFGASRRICPGQRMAEDSLLIAMAKLVWAFQIEAVARREELDLSMTGYKDGIVMTPGKVEMKFEVRGGRREVVEREWRAKDAWLQRFE